MSKSAIRVGIITVSDSCYQGSAVDTSGANLASMIDEKAAIPGATVSIKEIVPDDKQKIKAQLLHQIYQLKLDLILTTGGTGFSPRDVTPEATTELLEKTTPGISSAILKYSDTPFAALSRGVSGICNKTLIINLPGSKKGAQESLECISKIIPHAVHIIKDESQVIKVEHKDIQSNTSVNMLQTKVDISRVADRARVSIYPMIDVKTAQYKILNEVVFGETENISYKLGLGRVLAKDVYAVDDLPPFPASIKDGYAVIAADKTKIKKVVGASTAGDQAGGDGLPVGCCIRVNTGAPVPNGADSVIQIEDTKLVKSADDGKTEVEIEITSDVVHGQDIRPVGSDVKSGDMVLKKHTTLSCVELGLLATVGAHTATVFKYPTVGVLSTGNELQDPSETLTAGKIRDSNKTTLMNVLKENGFEARDLGISTDDPQVLLNMLSESLSYCDYIITSGSVSMGERDVVKQVLIQDFGAEIHFGRVNMKPGKPTTFATLTWNGKKKFVFGLPGNPVSCFVTSILFVLPALRKAIGVLHPQPQTITATIAEDIKLDLRPEYQRAVLEWCDEKSDMFLYTTGNQISSRLLSCTPANCLLVLPSKSTIKTLPAGSVVRAIPIRKF